MKASVSRSASERLRPGFCRSCQPTIFSKRSSNGWSSPVVVTQYWQYVPVSMGIEQLSQGYLSAMVTFLFERCRICGSNERACPLEEGSSFLGCHAGERAFERGRREDPLFLDEARAA